MAFLTPYPNTEGFTVVITKEHHGSYVFDVPEEVRQGIVSAACTVAKCIDAAFDDVGRTGLMFEGFGVDHLHAKLFPMHGTHHKDWQQWNSTVDKYFDSYEGYISSHNGKRANDADLEATALRIRRTAQRS